MPHLDRAPRIYLGETISQADVDKALAALAQRNSKPTPDSALPVTVRVTAESSTSTKSA